MAIGPYGEFGAYSYTADDGITYQIGVFEFIAFPGAGDLSPAPYGLLPLNALWVARHLVARATATIFGATPDDKLIKIPVNLNHPAWADGPGSEVIVLGTTYTVTQCVGERRFDNY